MSDRPTTESRESREALLQDLADVCAHWTDWWVRAGDGELVVEGVDVGVLASLDPLQQRALAALAQQALEGLVHSSLVVLDGRAHRCPPLDLRDPDGRSLGGLLHEQWYDFAPSTQGG